MTGQIVPRCQHFDLLTPALIFGGALLVSTALSGAVDTTSHMPMFIEEVKVARAEGVQGPDEVDMVGSCHHDQGAANRDARCRVSAVKTRH